MKILVCSGCVINNVKIGRCHTRSVIWKVLIIGHNDAMTSCCET
jgi:hypothetical protein